VDFVIRLKSEAGSSQNANCVNKAEWN